MSKNYEVLQKSRNLRKEEMVYVMGDKCQICGYNKCIKALEFHHINPEEKDLNFNKAESKSWEATKTELQKCILVCANCHREIHDNLKAFSLQSSYNSERAEEITQRIYRLKTHQDTYCSSCGAVISAKAKLCPKCSHELHRIVERPEREVLKQEIRMLSFIKIGEKYGVSDNAVRKWCIGYNLPSKKKDINNYTDEEWSKI